MDCLWPRLADATLREDPFPHWVLEPAIDAALYTRLRAEWPSEDLFLRGRRLGGATKIAVSAETLLRDARVTPHWREFLQRHRERAFVQKILAHFRPWFLRLHPDLEDKFGSTGQWRIGARNRDTFQNHDVLVDSQLAIFTPARGRPQWDRGPHVKLRNKLLTGYLFFPDEGDSSYGGDWDFFSVPKGKPLRYGMNLTVDPALLRRQDTIPYRENTFAIAPNHPAAVQGFRARTPGAPPLRYFEFTIQLPRRLYEVDETLIANIRNHWRTWTRAGVTDL